MIATAEEPGNPFDGISAELMLYSNVLSGVVSSENRIQAKQKQFVKRVYVIRW